MSKIIATKAIRGAHKIVTRAKEDLAKAIDESGIDSPVAFPDTNYYLPFAYAMLGIKAQKAKDLLEILKYAESLLPPIPSENVWLPYLGPTLDAGMATLFAQEIIEVLKYSLGNTITPTNEFWVGFTTDAILREQGIKLVDGRMPGFAAIVGAAPTNKEAVRIVRDLQERRILVFMSAETNGKCIAEQLHEEGVQMGWDTFLVPHGKDVASTIYALNFAARAAMTFGGITPKGIKEARDILLYNKDRVHSFVLALGDVDDEKHATAAGAINFGFPVVADTDIDQILPTGICRYEHVVSPIGRDTMIDKAIEIRGLKLSMEKIDIPVPYGPAFEGERVRKPQTACEIGGKFSKAFEYLRFRKSEDVNNGKIEVIGPELDKVPEGGSTSYAMIVDVAGRKMQPDFESVLERRFHTFLSEAMGIMHTGQRDMVWIRVSKEARKSGLLFKHFGVIIHSKLLKEFPSIVDKAQVAIYTKLEDVEKLLPEAEKAYDERDARLAGMTDESVDVFYSCKLCQSYAPNHVCIISPEKLGLCGAYNWLDGKAASEINPLGGNEPVKKGQCLDTVKGEWKGINDYIYEKSNKAISRFNMYSIMDSPTTSCGCFECIIAVLPEANGLMVVNRGYSGMTPCGMKFTVLAGSVGGGNQTPGFMGVGRLYLTSKKFVLTEGGLMRLVWMTKELKDALSERLKKRCEEIGAPDLLGKIADETVTTDPAALAEYLKKVNHPALSLPPIM
ncbi:MAG: CO dehydrogenase/CO-methylating acetyl-CoA synthase complex subunit beta [Omnitrophica bacterium RIFCSPLOWO2_01_FULL_45_10]|nr:MAG: CO dehydrogenase/CO-methylating acetyl-CoA synthase complex subunit beta [Omnitrophica bacterium RIFCSPLOWO2_01_FULL_45_10]